MITMQTEDTKIHQFCKTQNIAKRIFCEANISSVLGCPGLNSLLGADVWVKSTSFQLVTLSCNSTNHTWSLKCHGNQWKGRMENCSKIYSSGRYDVTRGYLWFVLVVEMFFVSVLLADGELNGSCC